MPFCNALEIITNSSLASQMMFANDVHKSGIINIKGNILHKETNFESFRCSC